MSIAERTGSAPAQVTDLLEIGDAYLRGGLEATEAIRQLQRRGDHGKFFAAEVALQEAYDTASEDWINTAGNYYVHTCKNVLARNTSFYGKALFRLAQLDLHDALATNRALPSVSTVRTNYEGMLHVAYDALLQQRALDSNEADDETGIELGGQISEMAIGILATRYALRIDANRTDAEHATWLPLQSTMREDHGGSCLGRAPNSWDLSIFTQPEGVAVADRHYRVQIKSSPNAPRDVITEDIKTIDLSPDLALHPAEGAVGKNIIAAAYHEHMSEGDIPTARITSELHARTEQLLDILG